MKLREMKNKRQPKKPLDFPLSRLIINLHGVGEQGLCLRENLIRQYVSH